MTNHSVAEIQESLPRSEHNGCSSGTGKASVENLSINATIDDRGNVFNTSLLSTGPIPDPQPKVQAHPTPNHFGPISIQQAHIDTQSQSQTQPTSSPIGPPIKQQTPITQKSQRKTLLSKPTWIRIPRETQNSPTDVPMLEKKHKRSEDSEEGYRPTKKYAAPNEASPEDCPTVVAARQPRRHQ